MASPNATFTELVTTTFRKHSKEIKDNVSNNNALLQRLMKKGNMQLEDGGLTLVEELEYTTNSTYQRYSGYDTLNISASDVFTAAEYQWRQVAVNVVASGLELRTNSGDSRIINLAKGRVKNAIRTFKNNFSSDVYSAGALANQVNGLGALVTEDGTGTVGGINSTNYTFWKNQFTDYGAATSSTIESFMLTMWLNCSRGDDKPDLIVAGNTAFALYEASQVSVKRYTGSDTANGGFLSLKYKGADVIYDGGSGIIADDSFYFLNTDYLKLKAHRDANLTVMEEMKPINQDAAVIPILWMGNLVCSNRARQGHLFT
jgi:hypothetical protein